MPDATAPELIIRVSYRVGDTQVYTSTSTTPAPTDANSIPMGESTTSSTTSMSTLSGIQLEAIDPASIRTARPVVLWRTHVLSRGSEDNLALIFAFMVAAMEPYFASTASTLVTVEVRGTNPEVQRLSLP